MTLNGVKIEIPGVVTMRSTTTRKTSMTLTPEKCRKDVLSISKAVGILRETADRWNDVDTFLLVAKRCRLHTNIDFMAIEGSISMYQVFDWKPIENFFVDTIKYAQTNSKRMTLVKKQTAREGSDDEIIN
ncbi:uncharacterized protein EV420DRAFT_1477944 [Desarmillaria tabescens]|uniref:Uncharacterized protein n=1 Tax=Armillaria tabescens TaxID=1929756 RepID=A0AA39N8Q8_ARMTA|nr:uncharacterized protein EV420DRAFT_1477944 [Desarmillaria tabescens]KAK0461106.1 hypothetical protein EV420DRAFT_1477944 [Desarmillaria tabescens]